MKKVAIVYDRVNKWGGAERVLLALHEIFPEAPLYTSVYDKKKASWANVFPEIKTSFLQKIPFAKDNHEFLAAFMPLAFESFDFSGYDMVISVTSESAKGIKTGTSTLHICYLLTPTRYLWTGYDEYFKNPLLRLISKPVVGYLKRWDRHASARPDAIIAISTEVKKRAKKFYKRDAEVVFPPVNKFQTPNSKFKINYKLQSRNPKYYLLVSRLDFGYKKVDLAIDAFNKSGKKLVVVGDGRIRNRLEKRAGKNVVFAGQVSEKDLLKYYRGAKALIMPQIEDFGIVAVEAQALGVPVIAYGKGGSLDTVIPGKTGIFFEEQSPESLADAVKRFEKMKLEAKDMLINAKSFSKERFKKELLRIIKNSTIGK